jgi:hypothetical protein
MADGVNYSLKSFDQYEARLGDELRGERATIGKSLLDVQRDLKIKASYIAAVENCDLDVFSNQGFIAGYVRSYARYLGLDPQIVYERFCLESGFSKKNTDFSLENKKPVRTKPKYFGSGSSWQPSVIGQDKNNNKVSFDFIFNTAPVLVVLSVLFIICFGAFSVLKEVQKLNVVALEDTPEIFTQITQGSAQLSLQEYGSNIYSSEELALPVFEPRDRAVSTLKPDLLTALEDNKSLVPASYFISHSGIHGAEQSESFEIHNQPRIISPAPVVRTVPNIPDVKLFALTPAWVRIKNQEGDVVFEKILKQKETYIIKKELFTGVLRAGNAQNVYFIINENFFGPLSDDKSVVKNVSLDPKAIKVNLVTSKSIKQRFLTDHLTTIFVDTAGVIE